MIKRIQNITGLGIFQNYRREGNLPEFSERNLIYGWNYSGKTTLSRLFSFLEKKEIPEEFSDAEFEIKLYSNRESEVITQQNIATCPVRVKVFNSDFIDDNLRYSTNDKKIQGIKFDVGENTTIRESIEANQKLITEKRDFINKNQKFTQAFNEFEASKFTSTARHIKNECFKSVIEFNKSHLKTVITQLDKNILDNHIIHDEALLKSTQNMAIAQNNKEPISIEESSSSFQAIFDEFERILGYSPNHSEEDEILSNNQLLYDWAKEGLSYHSDEDMEKCAFCGNQLSDNRVNFLNAFFTNQAALLKNDIQELKSAIKEEKEFILGIKWVTISPNDITDVLKEKWTGTIREYESIKTTYINLLDEIVKHLDKKYSTNLFVSVKLEEFDISANERKDKWLAEISEILKQHNESVEKFTTIRDENRAAYKKHLVASFLKTEKYYDIQSKHKDEEAKNNEALKIIRETETENYRLHSQLKSITAGKAQLNDFIKLFLNRDDIQIDIAEDDYFILKRGDKIARHLSEGEKTAIAFAHFIVSLQSIEKDGNLHEYVIFIDDPISSLDANHIAQVSALINSFFFRKATGTPTSDKVICKVSQLFIATHNFEFYSFLKDAPNIKRKPNSNKDAIMYVNGESVALTNYCCLRYFLIKRNSDCNSSILRMPKYLTEYKSEYVYLFSLIYSFYEAGCPEEQNLLMPNAVRRFLEIYTLTRLPGNNRDVDSRIREIVGDVTELKILHQFSHFTSFEEITKHSELLLRLPEIVDDIFTLLSYDKQHYDSLLQAISKSAPILVQEPVIS